MLSDIVYYSEQISKIEKNYTVTLTALPLGGGGKGPVYKKEKNLMLKFVAISTAIKLEGGGTAKKYFFCGFSKVRT